MVLSWYLWVKRVGTPFGYISDTGGDFLVLESHIHLYIYIRCRSRIRKNAYEQMFPRSDSRSRQCKECLGQSPQSKNKEHWSS